MKLGKRPHESRECQCALCFAHDTEVEAAYIRACERVCREGRPLHGVYVFVLDEEWVDP